KCIPAVGRWLPRSRLRRCRRRVSCACFAHAPSKRSGTRPIGTTHCRGERPFTPQTQIRRLVMDAWTSSLASWLIDYYSAATLVLLLILLAGCFIRQSIKRVVMAWATLLSLLVLAAL